MATAAVPLATAVSIPAAVALPAAGAVTVAVDVTVSVAVLVRMVIKEVGALVMLMITPTKSKGQQMYLTGVPGCN